MELDKNFRNMIVEYSTKENNYNTAKDLDSNQVMEE